MKLPTWAYDETHSTFLTWEPVIKLLWEIWGFIYYIASKVCVFESFVNFVMPKSFIQEEMDAITLWLYLGKFRRWDHLHLNDLWLQLNV